MKNKNGKLLNLIPTIISILCLIAVWSVASVAIDDEQVLPSFFQTVKKFFELFSYSEYYSAYFGTLFRSLISFVISFLIAMFLVWIFQRHKTIKRFVEPIISIIRVLPTVAVVLLLLLWTDSFVAPIVVTILVVLPTTFLSLNNAFASIDSDAVKMCEFFSVPKKDIFLKVQLPQIKPYLYASIGAGLSLNLKLMVAAEVIAFTSASIGNFIYLSNLYDATIIMMALVFGVVITGLIIEAVFSHLTKKAGKWL